MLLRENEGVFDWSTSESAEHGIGVEVGQSCLYCSTAERWKLKRETQKTAGIETW